MPLIQSPGRPVLIGDWERDEDFPFHPKGSQPKQVVVCPTTELAPFLVPGHHYIFKTIKKVWQIQQIWSEVIAYRIAAVAGIDAPPCFFAVDERAGVSGVLMEFFYDYPNEAEPARFMHATEYMARLADEKRGRPHAVRTNVRICRRFHIEDAVVWWGKVLVFDSLIGNTDRHPDNWGFLVRGVGLTLAPAFDNATSLGYEQPEHKLGALCERDRMSLYVQNGAHHCGWNIANDGPAPHFDLCAKFARAYPEAGPEMRNVIRFDPGLIREAVYGCCGFEAEPAFSELRARFVTALVEMRKARLTEVLGG